MAATNQKAVVQRQ